MVVQRQHTRYCDFNYSCTFRRLSGQRYLLVHIGIVAVRQVSFAIRCRRTVSDISTSSAQKLESVRSARKCLGNNLSSASGRQVVIELHQHQSTTRRHTTQDARTTLSASAASDAHTAAQANGLPGCCHRALQQQTDRPPNPEATTHQEQVARSSSSSRKEHGRFFRLRGRRRDWLVKAYMTM